MNEVRLFVYGTLRPGFDGSMAAWLKSVARHLGEAVAMGALYRVDYYPAFVPADEGRVVGDLFLLPDLPDLWAVLDEHEECAPHFPEPHEYRRQRLKVRAGDELVDAWTYVYARDVAGLARIDSGDFLA